LALDKNVCIEYCDYKVKGPVNLKEGRMFDESMAKLIGKIDWQN
jgi:hypothetical protein